MKRKSSDASSPHEMQAFLQRLAKFFDADEQESFDLIRLQIRNSLRTSYQDDEVIDEVLRRLIREDAEHHQKGEEIKNYLHMAKAIIYYVCRELNRRNPIPSISDGGSYDTSTSVASQIAAIERELQYNCYQKCLEEDPQALHVLTQYYPKKAMDRSELSELHKNLARELVERDGEIKQKKTTLQVRLFRIRQKLAKCAQPCLELERSKHLELQRLYEQLGNSRIN